MMYLQKATAINRGVPAGWLISEKFDGVRAWWDGGISRGSVRVPWRQTRAAAHPATGLWTSNGHPILAPDWWLDRLPRDVILDGELWTGYGGFQRTMSIVRRTTNPLDAEWSEVRFRVFDAPTSEQMFVTRAVATPTCNLIIKRDDCDAFIAEAGGVWVPGMRTCREGLAVAAAVWEDTVPVVEAGSDWERVAASVWDRGGEGCIIRDPDRGWVPNRVRWILKVKRALDAEGVVTGYTAGKGKYSGMIGSLTLCMTDGVVVNVSGLTDEERGGTGIPCVGDTVRYTYRELTTGGQPKEARILR